MAKKQFSNLSHDYELTFERETDIEKVCISNKSDICSLTDCSQCDDADDGVPQMRFRFIEFANLEAVQKDAMIDVIGVVKEVGEVSTITSKTTQKPYSKRDLTLVDKTNFLVRLTIWGNVAQNWDTAPDEVIAFKGVKVSDYGGRTLSMLHSSTMTINPDIDEAHALRGWYDGQGRIENFQSHQGLSSTSAAGGRKDPYKTLAQVKDENLGMGESPDYFVTKATVVYIKQDNISYPACMSGDCNKKVVQMDTNKWRCEKCDKTHPKPQHRCVFLLAYELY